MPGNTQGICWQCSQATQHPTNPTVIKGKKQGYQQPKLPVCCPTTGARGEIHIWHSVQCASQHMGTASQHSKLSNISLAVAVKGEQITPTLPLKWKRKRKKGKRLMFTIGLMGKHKLGSKLCIRTRTIQREKLMWWRSIQNGPKKVELNSVHTWMHARI